MNHNISTYIKKHTSFITYIVILVFLILFAGEYYLYRGQMKLSKMISEGFMQLKELKNASQSGIIIK